MVTMVNGRKETAMSDIQQPSDQAENTSDNTPSNTPDSTTGAASTNKAFVAGMQPGQSFEDFKANLIKALGERGFFDQARKNAAANNDEAKKDEA